MFGTLRFVLACLVAAGHAGVAFGGRSLGIAAVIVFYILSGYVMTHFIRSYYNPPAKRLFAFYVDRILRIYPQYLCYLLLACFFIASTGYTGRFMRDFFTSANMLNNALIVPLNYFHLSSAIENFMLIPPAWSLGVEVQFYALVPLVLMVHGLREAGMLLSLIVFTLASGGLIDGNLYGYRLLPGTFFVFLYGSLIYDHVHGNSYMKRYVYALYGYIVILCVAALGVDGRPPGVVYLGILVGIPVVFILAFLKGKNLLDEFFGNLSYGIFLSHFLVIWSFEHWWHLESQAPHMLYVAAVLLVSTLCAVLSYAAVERPVIAFRRRLRGQH